MAEFVPAGRTVPLENGWEWIAKGWELFKRQPALWIVLTIVLIVIYAVFIVIPVLGHLAAVLLLQVFAAGLMIGSRAVDEGGELKIDHLFAGFRERPGTLVAVGAAYLVAVVLIALFSGIVTGVNIYRVAGAETSDPAAALEILLQLLLALLVMLALLVPVLMAVWFVAPLAVFHQFSAVQAMKASFAGCLKNVLPFLLYGVILFLLSILTSITFGLALLVLLPVTAASVYASYRDIFFR